MITRGVPCVRLLPNSKAPSTAHGVKDGSLDVAQIFAWNAAQSNANCGACATLDGYWFLDADGDEWIAGILLATGQTAMPDTLITTTHRGTHFYFKHDDVSRTMGNLSISGLGEAR